MMNQNACFKRVDLFLIQVWKGWVFCCELWMQLLSKLEKIFVTPSFHEFIFNFLGDSMTTAVTSNHHRPPLPPCNRPNSIEPFSMKYKTVLRPNIPDVAIIYRGSCPISVEWAHFITNLMKCQGHQSIVTQELETLHSATQQGMFINIFGRKNVRHIQIPEFGAVFVRCYAGARAQLSARVRRAWLTL